MNQPSLSRFNVYQQTHSSMKIRLFQLQLQLQQSDLSTPAADGLLKDLIEMLYNFEINTGWEEAVIHNCLKQHAAAMVADLEDDHEHEEDLIARERYLINRWLQTKELKDRQAMLFGLNDFTAFKLTHMNREERECLPILWRHFNDEALIAFWQKVPVPQYLNTSNRQAVGTNRNTQLSGDKLKAAAFTRSTLH